MAQQASSHAAIAREESVAVAMVGAGGGRWLEKTCEWLMAKSLFSVAAIGLARAPVEHDANPDFLRHIK